MANLFDPPGTKLGTAWHAERDRIRLHLVARGGYWGYRLEARVTKIQDRLHRDDPSLLERQARAVFHAPSHPPVMVFTDDELVRIAEHFAMANDELGQSIYRKIIAI